MKRPGRISTLLVVYMPQQAQRSFEGSPTAGFQPFSRLFPDSQSYREDLAPRKDAQQISAELAETPGSEKFSTRIKLGMVFFGQFVDHDLDRNLSNGQGPSADPKAPINMRPPHSTSTPYTGLAH